MTRWDGTQEKDQGRSPSARATSPSDLSPDGSSQSGIANAVSVLTRARLAELLYEHEGFVDHIRGEYAPDREVPHWIESEIEKNVHWGDCTKVPAACMRCHADMALEQWDEFATMIVRAAQAIQARRAATLGAVHESAVGATDAPITRQPSPNEGDAQ